MKNKYWDIFYNDTIKNKKLVLSIIFVAFLCFGFTITNYSIGVDDPGANQYFDFTALTNMIQQGRLTHVLLYMLTGVGYFVPYFNDFLGAALFSLSSLLYCSLFQMISDKKINTFCLITFSTVYISYSIIVSKYVYNLDVIPTMLSYCACAISIAYSYLFVKNNKKSNLIFAILFLMLSIGSYETFIFLYSSSVLTIFLYKMIIDNQNIKFKQLFKEGLKYLTILCVSVIIYYLLVFIIQNITGNYKVFNRLAFVNGTSSIFSKFIDNIFLIPASFIAIKYIPLQEYLIFTIIGGIISIICTVKNKSFSPLITYILLHISNTFIFYFFGGIPVRATQTFSLFISFTAMILANYMSKKDLTKKIAIVLVVLIVFIQSADMNMNFYNDYRRSQKEKFVIDTVATDIYRKDATKSVVFISSYDIENPLFMCKEDENIPVRSLPSIVWALASFNGFYKNANIDMPVGSPFMFELFKMYGYDSLVKPNEEQVEKANELSKDMPVYPKDGYIKEYDDFIIVKMD